MKIKAFSPAIKTGDPRRKFGKPLVSGPARQPGVVLGKIRRHAKKTKNNGLLQQVNDQMRIWQARGRAFDTFLPGDPLYEAVLKYSIGSWELE